MAINTALPFGTTRKPRKLVNANAEELRCKYIERAGRQIMVVAGAGGGETCNFERLWTVFQLRPNCGLSYYRIKFSKAVGLLRRSLGAECAAASIF
jgi:hypothetical protein